MAVEPQPKSNPFIPAILVIVLVGLVALLLYLGDNNNPAGPKPSGPKQPGVTAGDESTDGMSSWDKMPELKLADYKDLGNELKYLDIVEGSGPECIPDQSVTIHYIGWLLNGTCFDSNLKKGDTSPVTFSLTRLIGGWQKGIPGMKPGGIRRLYVPPHLGYGPSGGRGIPPNATLVFEVKLIKSE